MKSKLKLRLGLLAYFCFLLITPGEYTLMIVGVNTVATTVSASSSLAFISFLHSRKPAEKNILNLQMQMHFYFKLLYYPYYSMLVYLWHRSHSEQEEGWELLLRHTIFSYSSARILQILSVVMYSVISASRTLLFISPAKFYALQTRRVLFGSILTLMLVFVFEVIMSQAVFSPARCDVNESGIYIHEIPHFVSKDAINNGTCFNQTILELPEKTCTLFPSFRIVIVLFLCLEATRLTVAVYRKYNRIKTQNKVSPVQTNPFPSKQVQQSNPIPPPFPFEPVQSNPLPSEPVQSNPLPSEPVQYNPLLLEPVQFNPLPSKPVQSNPLPSEPVQSNPLPSEPVQSNPLPSEPVQSNLLPSEPIQSSPLLLEPVLSNPLPSEPVQSNPSESVQSKTEERSISCLQSLERGNNKSPGTDFQTI